MIFWTPSDILLNQRWRSPKGRSPSGTRKYQPRISPDKWIVRQISKSDFSVSEERVNLMAQNTVIWWGKKVQLFWFFEWWLVLSRCPSVIVIVIGAGSRRRKIQRDPTSASNCYNNIMAYKFREEIVGKRFLSVSGFSKLKVNKISEWGWRAGVIRAASHRDNLCNDLQVRLTIFS